MPAKVLFFCFQKHIFIKKQKNLKTCLYISKHVCIFAAIIFPMSQRDSDAVFNLIILNKMSSLCQCPRPASLTEIPVSDCPETFGQIQKVAFQRLYKSTDGSKNGFLMPSDIKLKTSWTTKMAALDDTKIVISPYIEAPSTDPGGARTFGGGNETLGGIELVIGREPTAFTAVVRQMPQSVIKALKELECEEIGVYVFDEAGNIGAIKDPNITGLYRPIPLRSFFVSDKIFGGYEAVDSNNIQWSFLPNWSDDLERIKPTDFNPLTDLR